MRRRFLSLLCVFALCFAVLIPSQANTNVCFTAVNDRLLGLSGNSMPMWSEGTLYVPFSVFDVNTTGASLGTSSTYSRSSSIVTIFNLHQMLVFDLNTGTCRNQHTGETLSGRAIVRNGTAYVPVARVCRFFGLNYSYLHTDYGYLVRIISPGQAFLSNNEFIDAGNSHMRERLKDYTQSLIPPQEPVTPPPVEVTPNPGTPSEPEPTAVPTCLAVRCDTGENPLGIAQTLEESGLVGLFFFPAEEIGRNGALIRRLMGCGHSIGILAEGEDPQETTLLLELGSESLRTVARSRTYFALVPEQQQESLLARGWVFWNTTCDATPDGSRTPYTHAVNLVQSLPKRDSVQLILNDSQLSADAMQSLLRQLENHLYTITIPRETRM